MKVVILGGWGMSLKTLHKYNNLWKEIGGHIHYVHKPSILRSFTYGGWLKMQHEMKDVDIPDVVHVFSGGTYVLYNWLRVQKQYPQHVVIEGGPLFIDGKHVWNFIKYYKPTTPDYLEGLVVRSSEALWETTSKLNGDDLSSVRENLEKMLIDIPKLTILNDFNDPIIDHRRIGLIKDKRLTTTTIFHDFKGGHCLNYLSDPQKYKDILVNSVCKRN